MESLQEYLRLLLEYWYVFVVLFIVFFIFRLFSIFKPMRYLSRGNYAQAISKMERLLHTETYKKNSKLTSSLLYNIANCYNRQGDLRKSLEVLTQIDFQKNKDSRFLYCYDVLYAVNLFLLETDIEDAISMMDKAKAILQANEIMPLLALSEGWKGNIDKAQEYLNLYKSPENGKGRLLFSLKNMTLIYDKFTYEIGNNYFIALTYLKMGKRDQAYPYLNKATQAEYPNYYTEKAKEGLRYVTQERG